jgi:hypothetical protein
MHRSSDSIASLAAALAKAQMALTNPEKSLTGTLPGNRADEPGRTFRYAPLSAGLDIVRKVLGQHEGQSRPAAPKCSSAFQPSSAARLAQGAATNRLQSSTNNRHRWVGRRARAGRSRRDDTIQCRR